MLNYKARRGITKPLPGLCARCCNRKQRYSTPTQKPNHLVRLILVRLHSRIINRNRWCGKCSKAFYLRPSSAIVISRRVGKFLKRHGARAFASFKNLFSHSKITTTVKNSGAGADRRDAGCYKHSAASRCPSEAVCLW